MSVVVVVVITDWLRWSVVEALAVVEHFTDSSLSTIQNRITIQHDLYAPLSDRKLISICGLINRAVSVLCDDLMSGRCPLVVVLWWSDATWRYGDSFAALSGRGSFVNHVVLQFTELRLMYPLNVKTT